MTHTDQKPMKQYHGVSHNACDRQVFVEDSNGKRYELAFERSMEHAQHSPTGFNWGYGGSGPAQLALAYALLLDVTNKANVAMRYYQDFKSDKIANLSETWTLAEQEIHDWIVAREQEEAILNLPTLWM